MATAAPPTKCFSSIDPAILATRFDSSKHAVSFYCPICRPPRRPKKKPCSDHNHIIVFGQTRHDGDCQCPGLMSKRRFFNVHQNWGYTISWIREHAEIRWFLPDLVLAQDYYTYRKAEHIIWQPSSQRCEQMAGEKLKAIFRKLLNEPFQSNIRGIIAEDNPLIGADKLFEYYFFCPRLAELVVYYTIDLKYYGDNRNMSFPHLRYISLTNCHTNTFDLNKAMIFSSITKFKLVNCNNVQPSFLCYISESCRYLREADILNCPDVTTDELAHFIFYRRSTLEVLRVAKFEYTEKIQDSISRCLKKKRVIFNGTQIFPQPVQTFTIPAAHGATKVVEKGP